jgi:hypothetical protein
VLVTVSLVSAVALANPMLWPTREVDLDDDHYVVTEGHYDAGKQIDAIDFGVLRWDGGSNLWSAWEDDAVNFTSPDQTVTWDLPVYAPEDGEVVACWSRYVDGEEIVDACAGGCPDEIFAAGNFIMVKSHEGDHGYVFAHLREGSIPWELCPNDEVATDNNTVFGCQPLGYPFNEGVPNTTELALVNPGQPRPQVLKGDKLGNIGFNGASTAVHTHFEVFEIDWYNSRVCKGPSLPLEFYETWYQPRTPGVAPTSSWTSMNGDEVVNGVKIIVRAGAVGITRDDHDYNLDASKLHSTTHGSGGVMAYLDYNGQLDIRSYDIDASGNVATQYWVNEGAVYDVSVARFNTSRSVIVSIRGSNGNLKLIPYQVATNGVITRQTGEEVTEDDIGMVASIKSPLHDGVVVAVENDSGTLEVIDYNVDGSFNVTRNSGTGTGSGIDAVELTGLSYDFDGVVTAELIAGSGGLRLRSFEVPASGGVTNADTHTALLAGTDIDVDTVQVGWGLNEYVVTSLRQTDGTLRIDVWDVDAQGDIAWMSTPTEAPGAAAQIDGTSMGWEDYLSTIRDGNGQLQWIGWSIDGNGEIRRHATERFGFVLDAISLNSSATNGYIETLYLDSGNELRLLTVQENFSGGI